MKEQIQKFCKTYQLGDMIGEPHPVSGGLLHKMYRVETSQGVYAFKVLNPDIMRRPMALQNMINSEKVSNELKEVVPLVAAKRFDDICILEQEGWYFVVFDWLEGASVFAPDITKKYCARIGRALGKIHAANVEVAGMERSAECREVFDWKGLAEKLKQAEEERKTTKKAPISCYKMLKDFLTELLRLDEETVTALRTLTEHQVISHRDLDPKNVMWQGEQPYLIDWEAAGYVNPYQELAEVLNYWITGTDGAYDYEKFTALMDEYTKSIEVKSVDWDTVLKSSFDGMLGWLEYNVRRAAGCCGNDEADRVAGEEQVFGTIAEIKRQKIQMEQLKDWLSK